MTRKRKLSSGGPYEEIVGYSRAVAAGGFIFVSGCTSIVDGEVAHEGDMARQAEQAILIAGEALAGLGASLADVVQTRLYVTDISRWQEAAQAHKLAFGDVAPAATMVQVAALIDPRLLVEVEIVAHREGAPGVAGDDSAQPAADQFRLDDPA
ncbi:MAG TPA: RidA family protein [Trebonia sp.]|jgi:enamine deaminase RidA (YjgF/YER057c/UK114 family)|nr:RidA family protein [Trebonia sp.]